MPTTEEVQAYKRDGFIVLRNLLTPEMIEELRKEADATTAGNQQNRLFQNIIKVMTENLGDKSGEMPVFCNFELFPLTFTPVQ